MPPLRAARWLILLLVLPALACSTVYRAVGLERRATSTPRPPQPSRTPRPTLPPGVTPTPAPTLPADFADAAPFRQNLRPEFAADAELLPNATRYVIEVRVTFNADGSASLAGRERLRYTNQQTFPLDDLVLMLWPNEGTQYLGWLELGAVTVDGQPVEPAYEHGQLAARLALAAPLAPGASVEVSAEFNAQAEPGIDDSGAARFGLSRGVLLAPTFYPLIPRIVDGAWQTDPAPPGGDTTNSDSAFYYWRITAPANLAVAASGTVIDQQTAGGWQTLTLAAGPMRDLALTVGPLELSQRQVDGLTLNAYVLPEDAEYAQDMLRFAADQVKTLQAKVGPYPFTELDIVDAPGAFGGIEYPGLVYIGVVDGSLFFEEATVHEVGHQWFYSLIGDDQLLQPWLDEAAASYTEVLYREATQGQAPASAALTYFRGMWQAADNPDLPIGLPVGDYPSEGEYGLIVYSKGALFFDALRQRMGDEAFFQFLAAYFAAERYGFASAADFQASAEQACACDLGALFDLWVYKGGPIEQP